MKKSISLLLSTLMVFTMVFGLTGCGEKEVTLVNKTVNALSFDTPDDFGEFAETQGVMIATNEDSTASITVSTIGDAQGYAVTDWTEESYKQAAIPNFTDVKFLEFNTNATVDDMPALYAHFTAKNSKGVEFENYSYIIYFPLDDGATMFQSISFAANKSVDSSLKSNIDTIINSIKIG